MLKDKEKIFFLQYAKSSAEKQGSALGEGFVWPPVPVEEQDNVCAVLWEANDGRLYAVFLIWKDRDENFRVRRMVFRSVAPINIKISSAKLVAEEILIEIEPPIGTFVHPLEDMKMKKLLS